MSEKKDRLFKLHTEWADYDIALEVNAYAYGGNLAVMMHNRDTDFPGMYEPYGNATVNVGECEFLESAVDVNNLGPEIVDWLEKNGIAERTSKSMGSGFVEYPVMKFNEDLLREISPDGFATYEKAQLEHIYLDGMAGEYPELVEKLEKDLGIGEKRKPSELKAATEKPKAAVCEAATPGADGKVCSASAAARAGEGPAHEVKRQR